MDLDLQENWLVAETEKKERRAGPYLPPPYVTDEGFVLYDRREGRSRRPRPEQAEVIGDAASEAAGKLIKAVCNEAFNVAANEATRDAAKDASIRAATDAASADLVTQRMQHLSAMYQFVSAQARAQAEVARETRNDWYRPTTTRSANGV